MTPEEIKELIKDNLSLQINDTYNRIHIKLIWNNLEGGDTSNQEVITEDWIYKSDLKEW